MNDVYKQYVNDMRAKLEKVAQTVCLECLNEADYTNRSYNLHDSYGYAVYWKETDDTGLNTRVKRIWGTAAQARAKGAKNWYGNPISGAEEIKKYLKEYSFKFEASTNEFAVVVYAAMPYAPLLENGNPNSPIGNHKRYKVISMAHEKLRRKATEVIGDGGFSVNILK